MSIPLPNMTAGMLRHRVTLQRPTYTRNADGERVEKLEDVRSVWAWARRLRARERAENQQAVSEADWRVTIRYGAGKDLEDTDVIFYQGRRFDIVGIIDVDGERVWLEIDCKEHREGRA